MTKQAESAQDYTGGSPEASHLCVLVHGLWGNPNHMKNIAKSLRAEHPRERLYMLLARRNSGSFTYDGIELGGERVCAEIEEELRAIKKRGGNISKLSIVGYSLGGLVSRYAVGLLYAKGVLDTVECMNFATFASPHLGVRSPLKGWHNHVWNTVGARSLSMSGRQLFTIDEFRDTGRPLLSVLADPSSIFMRGMRQFKRHTLYTNVVNDRSAVYYTTGIVKTDPYRGKMDSIRVNFLKDGQGVILDPANPVASRPKTPVRPTFSSVTGSAVRWVARLPFMLMIAVLVPLGTVMYLCNSVIQTVRSASRIRQHETGKVDLDVQEYRVPLLIKELRGEVENAYEAINSSQNQEHLTADDDEDDDDDDYGLDAEARSLLSRERRLSVPTQPTLALTAHQFEMIRALDSLQWRKYPVWIRKNQHAHAAIIVRMEKASFEEGWVVLKHFASDEFLP